jgi:hypothetical protein
MKNFVLLFLLLGLITSSYAQNIDSKEISGTITYLNEPLKDVNILIKGSSQGTKTNDQGEYSLQAKVGTQIQYSYVGFNTVTILIEDVSSILNIEMDNYVNKLDEVIVQDTSKTKREATSETSALAGNMSQSVAIAGASTSNLRAHMIGSVPIVIVNCTSMVNSGTLVVLISVPGHV